MADERPVDVEEIFPIVYDELRRLARVHFSGREQTLQPTSLVHEAYLKLCNPERSAIYVTDRAHFCALAAAAMRQILVDRARRRLAQKRGGDLKRVTLTGLGQGGETIVDALDLEAALQALSALDERQARIVELRSRPRIVAP